MSCSQRRLCVLATLAVVCVLGPATEASATLPQSSGVLVWEPNHFWFPGLEPVLHDLLEDQQQYAFYVWQEPDFDNVPDRCTVPALRSRLTGGKGITLHVSHGTVQGVFTEIYTDSAHRDAAIAAYRQEGNTYKYFDPMWMQWRDGLYEINGTHAGEVQYYAIGVKSEQATAWCREFHAGRQGISFVMGCTNGAMGYNSFNVETNFGYLAAVTIPEAEDDLSGVFERMVDGYVGQTPTHTAAQAHDSYGDPSAPILNMWGAGATKLYPWATAQGPMEGETGVGQLIGVDQVYVMAVINMTDMVRVGSQDASGAVDLEGAVLDPRWGMPAHWNVLSLDPYNPWGDYQGGQMHVRMIAPPATWVTVRVSGELQAAIRAGNIYFNGDRTSANRDDYVYSFKTRTAP